MTTSYAITADRTFAPHPTLRLISQTLGSWLALQSFVLCAIRRWSVTGSTSDYFNGASDRVCMSAPITSFRDRF